MVGRWYSPQVWFLCCALAIGCTSAPGGPPEARPEPSSPLVAQQVGSAKMVATTDGRRHILYELLLVNQSPFSVKVDTVSTIDAKTGNVIGKLAGADLLSAARLTLLGGDGTTLAPSQSSLLFAEVILAADVTAPATISSRITATQTAVSNVTATLGGLSVSPQAGAEPTVTFDTRATLLDAAPPIVLGPPVRGGDWIVFRGCCDVSTSHRGGTGIYGGELRIAERFAVDLIKGDKDGMLVTGPGNDVRSYPQYGQPVYAVANGSVISAINTQPDEVPGALNNNLSEREASGNSVVLKIGEDRFVLYAHLQPGSVRVKAGDLVKQGAEIGTIGNSGRTFAPHLHLHVSSSPALGGDGLPFVISSFSLLGRLGQDPFMLAQQGQPATVQTGAKAAPRFSEHPLNNDVIAFAQ